MEKIPVVAVVGPTASGKSDLAVDLCVRFNGEAVSADSMQIYKGMDIASAKPQEDEKRGIYHHMMDFLDSAKSYSVADYQLAAADCIADIHSRGKLAVVVGGTGLYIDTLLNNIKLADNSFDESVRNELIKRAECDGTQALLDELKTIDPDYAYGLHINNRKRIVRALEVWYTTGKTMTQQLEESHRDSHYDVFYIGLTAEDRQYLYDRINRRVDLMIENGLIEEAIDYFKSDNNSTSSQAIGYKELKPYLDGKVSLEVAVESLKQATRHYAKRQITWFKRNSCINWLYIDKYQNEKKLCEYAEQAVEKFLDGGKA